MESDATGPREYKLTEVSVEGLKDTKEKIAKIIETISKPLFEKPPKENKDGEDQDEDDELDDEDDEVMSGIEQKMASEIKKELDKEFGSNWNVLVGNHFATLINLVPKDRHGTFKYGGVTVQLFEANNI